MPDVLAFADVLNAPGFHLVGHDWGGLVAWGVAAAFPNRLQSMAVLSTPHPDAFAAAFRTDPDQQRRSNYFKLFNVPNHAAEKAFLADNAKLLRNAYVGKLPETRVDRNVRRFSEEGTLTAALNWYQAADFQKNALGSIHVSTTYIWGGQDQALGEVAALATARYVTGPYQFERLNRRSHWLLEECPDDISKLVLESAKDE